VKPHPPKRVALLLGIALLTAGAPLAAQYTPPTCSGAPLFGDVANDHPYCAWIEQLWRDTLSAGCDPATGRFCPDDPITRAQAAMLVEKAVHDRLWGENRPNGRVYGETGPIPIETPCVGSNALKFGLSRAIVPWHQAAAACPAGTWVCTDAERGATACDTVRPDTGCRYRLCDTTCWAFADADEHFGWVADADSDPAYGQSRFEDGTGGPAHTCTYLPVWCCWY